MKSSLRLFASVKPAAASKYLKPFSATGLTGLPTHPCPRPALLHVYKSTLNKLQSFPESSVYRQAVEALTKHRLAIVESTKPEGHESWEKTIKEAIARDEKRKVYLGVDGSYVVPLPEKVNKEDLDFYGDERKPQDEGPAADEQEAQERIAWTVQAEETQMQSEIERLPQEPPLTAEQ